MGRKQGRIGDAIDRMRTGRKASLEARSEAAADQGNAVKAKKLSNRAEKIGNRMELKAIKKGGVLPATKKMGDYVGKDRLKGGFGKMAEALSKGVGNMATTPTESPEEPIQGSNNSLKRLKNY